MNKTRRSFNIYNKAEEYSLPTIFNTIMFGIDETKVTENIKRSLLSLQNTSDMIVESEEQK